MYPLIKNAKMGQKELLKTVGRLAVRLNLTKLRLKNHKKRVFLTKI